MKFSLSFIPFTTNPPNQANQYPTWLAGTGLYMPEHAEDVAVLRIVVREGFRKDMADMLRAGISKSATPFIYFTWPFLFFEMSLIPIPMRARRWL